MKSISDVIPISLEALPVNWQIVHGYNASTHRGCRVQIPAFWASAPVIRGSTAEPVCPNPAIHPIEPVCVGIPIGGHPFSEIGSHVV